MPGMLDGVLESTTTTGTADLDLNGAQTGFESFDSAGAVSGRQYYYYIADSASAPTLWERGVGTWTSGTPDTLSRDRVLRSSSGTSKISLLSGTTYLVACVDSVYAFQDGDFRWLTSVSGTDTITASASPTLKAYAAGQTFRFVAAGANTGTSVTLNVDSLGAKSVTKRGSTALVAGEVASGAVVEVVYDGTRFQVTGLVGDARLDAANTFTADQTIQSADAGASVAPTLALDRNSASPAASDQVGDLAFNGRDSGGNLTNYARISGLIIDPTDGSEDGRLDFWTNVGGTLNSRAFVQQGFFMSGATGSDKGAGTINATGVYESGVKIDAKGAAKGWAKIQGSTGGLLAGFNTDNANITRNTTGDYTIGWITDFASANYAVVITAEATAGDFVGILHIVNGGQTASAVNIKVFNNSGTAFDPTSLHVVAFGDQ